MKHSLKLAFIKTSKDSRWNIIRMYVESHEWRINYIINYSINDMHNLTCAMDRRLWLFLDIPLPRFYIMPKTYTLDGKIPIAYLDYAMEQPKAMLYLEEIGNYR